MFRVMPVWNCMGSSARKRKPCIAILAYTRLSQGLKSKGQLSIWIIIYGNPRDSGQLDYVVFCMHPRFKQLQKTFEAKYTYTPMYRGNEAR